MTEGYGGDAAVSLAEMLDERQHLLEIALWIFDSYATWIVQDTYRRWYDLDDDERAAIAVPRAWLTRVAGRICLELLASPTNAQTSARPVLVPPPHHQAAEPRGAQLQRFSRRMLDRHTRVVRRFATACESGDIAALEAILADDVVVVNDGGGKVRAAIRPVHGARPAARFVAALLTGKPGGDHVTDLAVEPVNGRAGVVLRRAGQAVAVVDLNVAGAEITAVWVVLNPDKLRGWQRP